MISRLLAFAVRWRVAVVCLFAVIAVGGAVSLSRLPIDAVPDITNKQVQINSVAPSLSPLETEKLVSFPVESVLAGIPGLEGTRSISRSGFSQVTAVFEEHVDIYFARQQVAERLSQVRGSLPPGVEPEMGAVTTGLGEVLLWSIDYQPFDRRKAQAAGSPGWQPDGAYLTPEGDRLADPVALGGYLRSVQEWIIKPQIRAVAGVAGIDSIGGYEKQYVVRPEAAKLSAYGISYTELVTALAAANVSVGADYIPRGGEAFLVRTDARVRGLEDIARAAVASRHGVPVLVRDLASVTLGGDLRTGAASEDGREVVIGTVQMLAGANSRTVALATRERVLKVAKTLPPGLSVRVVYDRSRLVDATIHTVGKNLAEGAIFVVAVLFLLLGNVRAALIATLVIPLSMLMTAMGMQRLGVSGNLMSLGALDFGLIVDGAVIIVENCLRHLAHRQQAVDRVLSLPERLGEVVAAAKEMIQPTLYGQAIILLVYAPLLTFQGVEGKMFGPMALTVMLALASALVISLTLVPAMTALLVTGRVAEKDVKVIAAAKDRYAPALAWVLQRPRAVIGGGVAVFLVAALMFLGLGREFIPQLDEQDLALEGRRLPSISLSEAQKAQAEVERLILKEPEVATVFSKLGTSEAANDPVPPNSADTFIIMKPRREWPKPHLSKTDLIERFDQILEKRVGETQEVSQPIQMRFNELIAGVKGDLAVKVYGENLDQLAVTAAQIDRVIRGVPGAADVRTEQTAGFPTFDVQVDRDAAAAAGVTVEEVADTVAIALGGRAAGVVLEGDRQTRIMVRAGETTRADIDAIGALPVMLPASADGSRASVPLRTLARFTFIEGLNQVSRENGKRRVVVQANVRGRDLGSFVAAAQQKVAQDIRLPPGVWIEWGGQFQNLKSAQARLSIVVPICFVLVFALLLAALRSWKAAGAVFSAVPLALAGGVFALALRGMPFSISAAVGLIALSGVAVLNGLVMMGAIRDRLAAGLALDRAITEGAMERLRPVLMTALVASLGFVPMALATGTGAEVQRPLATVVIGGLITATALTLFVLPAICRLIFAGPFPRPAA